MEFKRQVLEEVDEKKLTKTEFPTLHCQQFLAAEKSKRGIQISSKLQENEACLS